MRRRRARLTEYGLVETVDGRRRRVPLIVFTGVLCLLTWRATSIFVQRVASGEETVVALDVEVPRVVGLSSRDASAFLEIAGLVPNVFSLPNEVVPPGQVFRQGPVAGAKITAGSGVLLLVSAGPAQFTVPEVAGQQMADAMSVVAQSGLTPVPVAEYSDTVRTGEVMETRPRPGKALPPQAPVQLVVSGGEAPRPVPAVVGQPIEKALNLLGLAELGVGDLKRRYVAGTPEGQVLETSPPAGTVLGKNQPVSFVLSGPPPVASVPSVEGLVESVALDEMASAGIEGVVREIEVPYGSEDDGRVIRQGVPPLAEVPPGFRMEIIVGRAPPPPTTIVVEVPVTQPTQTLPTETVPVETVPTTVPVTSPGVTGPTTAP